MHICMHICMHNEPLPLSVKEVVSTICYIYYLSLVEEICCSEYNINDVAYFWFHNDLSETPQKVKEVLWGGGGRTCRI